MSIQQSMMVLTNFDPNSDLFLNLTLVHVIYYLRHIQRANTTVVTLVFDTECQNAAFGVSAQ